MKVISGLLTGARSGRPVVGDVNEKDSEGNSPVLLACRSGNLEMTEMLVVTGAGVSDVNERGDTPLLTAVGTGKLTLVEMLVRREEEREENLFLHS
jgi:ankyrin repeat protein